MSRITLDDAYRYCDAVMRARPHEFPVGSVFAPPALRKHLRAIHAFARVADDFADEPEFAGRREAELDAWEQHLRGLEFEQEPTHPVFVALAHTIDAFDLPAGELDNVLRGIRLDMSVDGYATFSELRGYIQWMAEPIGRLYMHLAGYREPALHRYAEELASGLLQTKMLQNLSSDLSRGKLYLPAEDLRHFEVPEQALARAETGPQIDQLIRYSVARARATLERARPLLDRAAERLGAELHLTWITATDLLEQIERAGAAVLRHRPTADIIERASITA